MHANGRARRILDEHDGFSLLGGSPAFADSKDVQRYRPAIARTLDVGRTGSSGAAGMIRLQRSPSKGRLGMIYCFGWSQLRESEAPMVGSVVVFLSALSWRYARACQRACASSSGDRRRKRSSRSHSPTVGRSGGLPTSLHAPQHRLRSPAGDLRQDWH